MKIAVVDIFLMIIYFLSLYFAIFWMIVFFEKDISEKKKRLKRHPLVTVVLPAYNEEKTIIHSVKSVLNLNYPKDKLEIIVVNDGSQDRTREKVEEFKKLHPEIILINQKNQGKGVAMNKALKIARGEFFVCLDADSIVHKDALRILLPEFENKNVAIALPILKAKKPKNILQWMQKAEYLINFFYKKLMGCLDCIHVAPGPFSVYRTEILRKVGGFDESNLTEDLEMAIRLQKHNYKLVQNNLAEVYTPVPSTFKSFYRQRNRWFKGGILNALKYRNMIFNPKYGDFGLIQIPILILSAIFAVVLLVTTAYSFFKPYVLYFLNMRLVEFDFLTFLKDITFNVYWLDLNFINTTILIFMLCITSFVMYLSFKYSREKVRDYIKPNIVIYIMFYFFILSIVWLGVVKDLIFKRIQTW
ncbi:glycosyltransferase family 2 protein [Candidatus Woesearchaeota archaeon]|nr:MAG: glycosyltransferase family 2 protein [Candidatus Woesearchaeota archaeon]